MSAPEITPRAFFSLRTDVRQNAHYISDFQILYPAGSVLIVHNYYEKRQRFIKLFEKSMSIEFIAISPSRKFAGVIQNSEKGQVLIFDLLTLKKKRTLNLPQDVSTNRFEYICFSCDDVFLMALVGAPDWTVLTYRWLKGKVINIIKLLNPGSTSTIVQVSCSPTSNSEICIVGNGVFKLFSLSDTVWKQYGFQKADTINITTAVWLASDKILCGTFDGKLIYIENGDLRGVYNALTITALNIKEKDDSSILTSSSMLITKTITEDFQAEENSVRALISFSKGFAYSCKVGYVHLFEKDGNNKYKKRNVFLIQDTTLDQEGEMNFVKHLSINVSEDKLLATTKRAQLYMVRLWGPDINIAPVIPFRILGEPLHHSTINGLSMCIWKAAFATCGKVDRTVRIWNFETDSVQLVKHYSEDVYCIDLHPTGLFIAIGFVDRIDQCVILINDIVNTALYPVSECNLCKFCSRGDLFAAVNGCNIEVYNTITYKKTLSFEEHTGKIYTIRWSTDDTKLISCASDGMVITWDMLKEQQSAKIHTPGVCYYDIALSSDAKFIYAVGDDGLLKEIVGSEIIRSVGLNQKVINNITLSRSNLLMFLTAGTAEVLSVKMPLTDPPEYAIFPYHSTRILRMALSYNDMNLVSVSEGGTLIIWKLNFAEGKTVEMDKNFIYSNEILVNKGELEQKILKIKDLTQKLYELEMSQAREMRDTESNFCEKIKDIHENYGSIIKDLKEKIELTEIDQKNQLVSMKKEIDELKKKQEIAKEEMYRNYNAKLIVEYEKVTKLDALKEETVRNFEDMVEELLQCKENETNEIIRIYEEKLAEVSNSLKESYDENLRNIEKHEIKKQYLEEDLDRELIETRAEYEKTFKQEKELGSALQEEAIIMKRKHAEAQKQRDEFRYKKKMLIAEQQKLQSNIQGLEKDIADLKAEIVDRDQALEEKDKRIYSLKKKIQELEKFKFVLDYKIKELQNQIDPKDREIKEKKEQISDMEAELENLKKINASLELQAIELKEKINGTEKEVCNYETKHKYSQNNLRQIQVDIYFLHKDLNDFEKLRFGLKALFHKYNTNELNIKDQYGDTDYQKDLILQREFLEKTIVALKSTLSKEEHTKKDGRKVIEDNVILLEELNTIRKELKEAVTAVRKMEKLIEIRDKNMVPSEAVNRMQQALKKQDTILQLSQNVIAETDKEMFSLSKERKRRVEQLLVSLQPDNYHHESSSFTK